jgi:polyphenol oxidase
MHSLPMVTGPDWGSVHYFCTTRQGGVGQKPHDTLNLGLYAGDTPACVQENGQRVRAVVLAEPFWLRQVHGSHVLDADDSSLVAEPEADASITAQPGRVLAIMVADCLPVTIKR